MVVHAIGKNTMQPRADQNQVSGSAVRRRRGHGIRITVDGPGLPIERTITFSDPTF